MTEEDYLWDRSGEGDAFLSGLDRELEGLGLEGESLLAELDLDALADAELAEERTPSSERDDGAIVLQLPTAALAEPPARSQAWMWMSAAALLLLVSSVVTLVGSRRPGTAGVAGKLEEGAARVRIDVERIETDLGASREHALEQLRGLHLLLGRCALRSDEAALLELNVGLGDEGGTLRTIAFRAEGPGQDQAQTQTRCVREAWGHWQPAALGTGEMQVLLEFEAANRPGEQPRVSP